MTRYLIMSCKFILTVNLMFNMSFPKPSCSHFQFNELVLSNFRLMYNITVFLSNMLNECHCPVNSSVCRPYLQEITYLIVIYSFL